MVQEKTNLISSQSATTATQQNKENATTSANINETPKEKNWKTTVLSWLPSWLQFRKDLKASIALIIGTVFALADYPRSMLGDTALLVPIVMIFYFPVRPYGVQTEAVIYGTTGAVLAALYSLLGTFLADLARDHSNKNPIQPGVCAILGVFLFFGIFILNYIRMNYLKANFAVVNGCILICFTFTYGAVYPIFSTELTWLFLRPIAVAGALSLAVNYFLWPDDSVTNYMGVINKVLTDGTKLFKENSEAFLEMKTTTGESSLGALRAKLQGGILLLIECKRAVQREITFTKLSPTDITALTRILKSMYPTLHGLGLSTILEKDYLSKHIQDPLLKTAKLATTDNDDDNDDDDFNIISGFEDSVNLMKPACHYLTQSTAECLEECKNSLNKFQKKPRTMLNSILWPFPRIYGFNGDKEVDIESAQLRLDQTINTLTQAVQQFDQFQQSNQIQRYTKICQQWKRESMTHSSESLNMMTEPDDYTYGPLYLIFLYQTSLREYCSQVLELAHFIQQLQNERKKRTFHLPKKSLKKWFRSANSIESNYTATHQSSSQSNLSAVVGHESDNINLIRTTTRPNELTENDIENGFVSSRRNDVIDDQDVCNSDDDRDDPNHKKKKSKKKKKKIDASRLYLDPDVLPPATSVERFFFQFYKIYVWLSDFNTVFALKTAIGVTLFSIPAWRPESAAWYNEYKGQWCLITICLWLFPTSGLFLFGLYTRVLGTIVGAVIGAIIWEITRGNVYGVAILCFILYFPMYHVFFYNAMYRVAALLGKITMILVVIYGYEAAHKGETDINSIWYIVAHRIVAIVIGIVAAGVLITFPTPVQGRVELRKRLAITIRDIGRLYGIISAEIALAVAVGEPTRRQIKHFRKLALDIRRQIADERNLLAHAKYEPPLRGKFPVESYTRVLNIVDNMADLVGGMGYNIRRIRPEWRTQIANSLMKERKEYLSNIMTTLKLISTTLLAKTPLPPFLLQPNEAMDRFAKILENEITLRVKDMEDPSFTSYSAYMMNASSFVKELNDLLEATTALVGVDAPDLWLKVHQ